MNKIFKIVFNAARGKMMVVNEATSSVQTGKKAAVTVAVIGALTAGSAMAAATATEISADTSIQPGDTVSSYYKAKGTDVSISIAGSASEKIAFEGVGNESAHAYGDALRMQGFKKVTLTNVHLSKGDLTSTAAQGVSQGAGYHQNSGELIADGMVVTENYATGPNITGAGATLFAVNGTITNSEFSNNTSETTSGGLYGNNGGGLFVQGAQWSNPKEDHSLSITKSEFTANEIKGTYAYGGGMFVQGDGETKHMHVNLDEVQFSQNKTTGTDANETWGGAIGVYGASMTIENSTFDANIVEGGHGGAIANVKNNSTHADANKLTIENTTFERNVASNNGGAIYSNGDVTLTNTTFTENKADWGGAIFNKGTMTITDSHFEGNQSTSVGGAITTFTATSDTTIDNVVFKNNHSDYDGGAIGNYAALTITNSTFEGNSAQLIDGVVPEDDTAIGGGAIALGAVSSTKVASITGTKFLNNKSGVHGGAIGTRVPGTGIDNVAAKLDIEAYFEGNSALENGGAIHNSFFTNNGLGKGDGVTVKGEFVENTAKNGGAIYNLGGSVTNQDGVMTITDSTFTGNVASEKGGAIYNANVMTLVGTNTFTDNTAAEGNDVYNTGTLNIDGTATFNGGIVSTEGAIVNVAENATVSLGGTTDIATLNGSSATLEVTSTTVEIAENNMTETTLVASGSVNDALGGDADALADLVNAAEGSLESVTMAEGEVMGAVTATVEGGVVTGQTVAVNEKTEALAEKVTLAPQMITRIMMNDLRKRMGDIRAGEGTHGAWARYNGGEMSGQGIDNDFHMVQVGIDTVPVADAPRFGVAFSYAQSEAKDGYGTTDMDSYSLAVYGTKMYDNGMFVDVIGRMATMDTDMVNAGYKAKMDNVALSLSGEFGWRFDVTDSFFIEPSVEATYTYTNADKFTMGNGTYELEATDSLVGRAGFAAGFKCPKNFGDVYVRAAVVHEFMGDTTMNSWNASGAQAAPVEADGEDTYFEYAIGAQFNVNKNTYVYADVERTEGAALDEDWRANVGVRFAF